MLRELADMPAGIRALEATGTLTSADYARIFAPMVEQAGRTGGRLRLLYEFAPGFQRITGGALWADARLGTGYLRLLDGVRCRERQRLGSDNKPRHRQLDAVPASGVPQRRTR